MLILYIYLCPANITPSIEYSLVYYHAIWFSFLAVALFFISQHGTAYVAWPRLNASAVRDVLMYDGPGYRSRQHGRGFSGKDGKKGGGVRMGHLGSEKGSVGRMEEVEMGEKKRLE